MQEDAESSKLEVTSAFGSETKPSARDFPEDVGENRDQEENTTEVKRATNMEGQ